MNVLTSVIFKNAKRREKISRDGKIGNIFSILSFIIVFGTLAVVMVGASFYITHKLLEINQTYAFINIMLFVNFGILFLKSIFEILNVLYFSKDLKILLRMPIKSKYIIHSKLLKIITAEYEMELIMLAIPMIVYGMIMNINYMFYIFALVILLVLPIIPICITAIIVAIIMRLINSFKNKNRVMYIAIICATIFVEIILSMLSGNGLSVDSFREAININEGLAEVIADNFKLIKPIMNSLFYCTTEYGTKNLLIFTLASIATYIVTIFIISPIYLKGVIGTVVNGNRRIAKENSKLDLEDFKVKKLQKAYIQKEYMIMRRSPIFFIECLILPILFSAGILLLAIGLATFTKLVGYNMIEEITEKANKSWGTGVFISISQVFYMINFTSIIAVSKEERWAILSKYIPIKFSRQINMKLFIGKLTNFIASLSVVICYYVCTQNIIYSIMILLLSLGLNVFGEKVKIWIDLRNPKIDWDNEYTMMKQNTNVMYELFYTMIVIFIVVGLGFIFENIVMYLAVLSIIMIAINMYSNKYIYRND